MARRGRVQHLRARAEDAADARPHPRDRRAARRPRRGGRAAATPTTSSDAVRKLGRRRRRGVAVCFLFAYANPAHEQAAAEIIRDIAPELYVSLSHEVNPEWREYERTASTVANAYIGPPVSRYLHELEQLSLRRFPALARADDEVRRRRRQRAHARAHADPDRDVGTGRRRDRQPPSRRRQGHRQPHHLRHRRHQLRHGGDARAAAVQVGASRSRAIRCARHTVDIETIGAGGGSIASVQLGGVLKVGPQSAGADPGPGLLRPRRQRADADRCAGAARPSQPDGAARRRDADSRGQGA